MKKRVLILSLSYYPRFVGGAEVAIKEITERLSNKYEFHLICNRYDSTLPTQEVLGSVTVHRIGFVTRNPSIHHLSKFPLHLNKALYQWLAYRKACSLHHKYHFDLMWAMMAHSCGVPAALFKRTHPDVPYVLTLQEGDPPKHIENRMKVFGGLFRSAFVRADVIQSISTFLQEWAQSMGHKGKSVVIPNAVNVKHFSRPISTSQRYKVQKAFSKRDGDVWLVTTSRLVYKNALDDVIRALHHLPKTVHFFIYGIGPEESKLKHIAKKIDVDSRVHFEGEIPHDVMPLHLKACDIFVRPSRSEGMGNSFIEAMAVGLPVIATQEGGIADFLFDAERNPEKPTTGWAVQKDSPKDIANAVKKIITDPENAQRVTTQASIMVAEHYDWDTIAHRMNDEVFAPLFR